MDTIRRNWEDLRARIARAAERAGREAREIAVVAVTKTRTAQEVEAAFRCGLRIAGENRVQEAEAKMGQVGEKVEWHLIGHLQSNKAGRAAELFDMVQSVDRLKVARALDQRAGQLGRTLDVLVQVNTAGAAQQSGVDPEAAPALVEQIASLEHLRVRGLMTIAALSDDEAEVRACFIRLRALGERLAADCQRARMDFLSMGMSGDFELAVEEGANLLRLGSALFGPRPD